MDILICKEHIPNMIIGIGNCNLPTTHNVISALHTNIAKIEINDNVDTLLNYKSSQDVIDYIYKKYESLISSI